LKRCPICFWFLEVFSEQWTPGFFRKNHNFSKSNGSKLCPICICFCKGFSFWVESL
jgi:hypothetical protein